MGGYVSSLLGSSNKPTIEPEGFDEPEAATGLTPREKKAIVDTWAMVKPQLRPTGVALLLALFEKHPEHKQLFPAFKDTPTSELSTSKKFAAHASSVMHAVASLVDSLDDTDCLVELLTKVGNNHKRHQVSLQAFQDLKVVLLDLLSNSLGDNLSPVAAEAWDKMLTVANTIIGQQLKAKPTESEAIISKPTEIIKAEPLKKLIDLPVPEKVTQIIPDVDKITDITTKMAQVKIPEIEKKMSEEVKKVAEQVSTSKQDQELPLKMTPPVEEKPKQQLPVKIAEMKEDIPVVKLTEKEGIKVAEEKRPPPTAAPKLPIKVQDESDEYEEEEEEEDDEY